MSRYRSGETNELRADASKKLKNVRAEDIMKRAGVLRPRRDTEDRGHPGQGWCLVRNGADEGYDYRVRPWTSRTPTPRSALMSPANSPPPSRMMITPGSSPSSNGTPPSTTRRTRASTSSDQFGFHFDHTDSVHIDWI